MEKIKCKKCGKDFTPSYRNGILVSKVCHNCLNLKAWRKSYNKKSNSYGRRGKVAKNGIKRGKSDEQKMMAKADEVFSRYIRVKFAIESGGELFCKDIMTGKLYGIKNIDNGHFYSRKFKGTRYEEDNCRPQNRSSNRFSGEADHDEFGENLLKEIGAERMKQLTEKKKYFCSESLAFYTEQFNKYSLLLDDILNDRGWENPWSKKH